MSAQIMVNDDVRLAIKEMKQKARTMVSLGMAWRDHRKPLGRRHAPGLPPLPGAPWYVTKAITAFQVATDGFGLALGQRGSAGRALEAAAHAQHLAAAVQNEITKLAATFGSDTRSSVNLFYLQHIADATVLAAQACCQLQHGKSPRDAERTKRAVAWVVILACATTDAPAHNSVHYVPVLLDERVKAAAIHAYPLFSAGRGLDTTIDPADAIHAAFEALDLT